MILRLIKFKLRIFKRFYNGNKYIVEQIKYCQDEYFKTDNLCWKHHLYGGVWALFAFSTKDLNTLLDKDMLEKFNIMCEECNPRQVESKQ